MTIADRCSTVNSKALRHMILRILLTSSKDNSSRDDACN
ncbi:hypothetical protein KP509_08G015100 [Ceratopteris richardii]|uniref:Uncharacterized protein n=1 Tax=Ceratopteris richardii TaxID=49495 RepID=A0A8T2UA79_CERRI|nr:hypothetical protein KP509_08G015100 [Ceratopteris richardii]